MPISKSSGRALKRKKGMKRVDSALSILILGSSGLGKLSPMIVIFHPSFYLKTGLLCILGL